MIPSTVATLRIALFCSTEYSYTETGTAAPLVVQGSESNLGTRRTTQSLSVGISCIASRSTANDAAAAAASAAYPPTFQSAFPHASNARALSACSLRTLTSAMQPFDAAC